MPWSVRRSGSNGWATRLRGVAVVDSNHPAAYAAPPLLSTRRVRAGLSIAVAQMVPRVCPSGSARNSSCRPSGRNHGQRWAIPSPPRPASSPASACRPCRAPATVHCWSKDDHAARAPGAAHKRCRARCTADAGRSRRARRDRGRPLWRSPATGHRGPRRAPARDPCRRRLRLRRIEAPNKDARHAVRAPGHKGERWPSGATANRRQRGGRRPRAAAR